MKKIIGLMMIICLSLLTPDTASANLYTGIKGFFFSGDDLEDGYGISMAVGYKYRALRLEGELEFRDTDVGNAAFEIQLWDLLINAYADFENTSAFTPYIGGGAGYGWFDFNSGFDYNDTAFVYQGTAGVAWRMSHNAMIDLHYRFFSDTDNYDTNNYTFGLRFEF